MSESHGMMTTKELADAMRVGVRTIERWRSKGFTMTGRRATLAELRAWLAVNGGNRRNMPALR